MNFTSVYKTDVWLIRYERTMSVTFRLWRHNYCSHCWWYRCLSCQIPCFCHWTHWCFSSSDFFSRMEDIRKSHTNRNHQILPINFGRQQSLGRVRKSHLFYCWFRWKSTNMKNRWFNLKIILHSFAIFDQLKFQTQIHHYIDTMTNCLWNTKLFPMSKRAFILDGWTSKESMPLSLSW